MELHTVIMKERFHLMFLVSVFDMQVNSALSWSKWFIV